MKPKSIDHILFVDDDEEDYCIYRTGIQNIRPGTQVSYLGDSVAAINYLDENGAPDLIFLDINMPKQDGFETLTEIRNSRFSEVPVVVLSSTDNEEHIRKAYHHGASLFCTKASSLQQLTDSLNGILKMNWEDPGSITRAYYNRHLPLSMPTFG